MRKGKSLLTPICWFTAQLSKQNLGWSWTRAKANPSPYVKGREYQWEAGVMNWSWESNPDTPK